ncbi:hypothetical protein Sango_1055800 [Sesamum angolense]|uniref:Uncharacterized protein n=1 Tax=Sesamum angolense TaxID=2727404 RepID=A0AAE1X112_9LAMI|nr:hypothetical protein Sango_1055800 [Sesamum angolense]
MDHSKQGFFPMRYGVKLSEKQSPKIDGELKKMFDVPYASVVAGVMSRYQACAGETHWTTVKTILKYLIRTKNMFFVYDGGELILEGYSSASFQSDDDDAKSQSDLYSSLMVVWWLERVLSRIPHLIPPQKLNT